MTEVRLGRTVERVRYRAGEARFTPAGQRVAFRWKGEVRVLMLGFQPWLFERIAAELGVSEITVKVHRSHMMRKMRTRSLAQLARIADSLGICRDKPQRS